jgi:hypothetical protein
MYVGTLPDGSATFQMICPDFRHQIRWLKNGFIIALSSDLPLQRLQELAADVVLRYLRSH